MQLLRMLAATGALVAAIASSAIAGDVSGAGATFPYPIYAKWGEAYKKQTGITVHYQSVGSGEGIRQIQNKEVTFGASDMPLKAADLDMYGLVQFPTVIGGVVPVVNVEGVKAGDLTLDGPTLARIFLGEIKSWNDAALRKLNPSLKLPSQPIAVVHRSDGSGTTFVFTDYLSKMSADWRSKVGSITAVDWPVGAGARGNEGVAAMVARIKARSDTSNTPMPSTTSSRPPNSRTRMAKQSRRPSSRSRPLPAAPTGKQRPASASF